MSHARKQIRDAALALLQAGVTATVSGSRVHNFQLSDLPAIAVYTVDEQSEAEPVERRTLIRQLELVVDALVATTGDVEDDADALIVQIEEALEGSDNGRFGGLANDSELRSTRIGLAGDADNRHATVHLVYGVEYWTLAGDPENIV
jgi:hypothetical protein